MCRWDHSILTDVHIHVQHMDTYTRHIPTHLWVHIFMRTEEHNTCMHTHRYMHTQGTMHMHMTTYSIYANIHKQTRLHTNATRVKMHACTKHVHVSVHRERYQAHSWEHTQAAYILYSCGTKLPIVSSEWKHTAVPGSFQDGYMVSHLLHCHSKPLYLRKTWCMVENHSKLHEQDA